jgi:RNA polymerase sigma-70 factor, ECF subfamily
MSPPVQDADLIRAVGAGDRDALRGLYDLHAPWLVLRLSRRCNDDGLVDEVVQDTFLAVWKGAKRWDGRGEPAAWIWGIGVRRLVDALRRKPRATLELSEQHDDVVVSAEELVLLGVEHGDVGAAMGRLSPELRAALQATVLDGLTTKEAGHLLGIPAGTVKTRVMRAKAALREDLA